MIKVCIIVYARTNTSSSFGKIGVGFSEIASYLKLKKFTIY